MKSVVALLLVLGIAGVRAAGAGMETLDLFYGRVDAPEGYTLKRTGTADSYRGTLTRASDGFTISFDIGYGTRVTRRDQDPGESLWTHSINGESAYTRLERVDGKLTIATTICDWCEQMDQLNQEHPYPANFSADIARDEDLAEFMLIVDSWRDTGVTAQAFPPIIGDRAQGRPADETFAYGQTEDGLSLGIWNQRPEYQLNHQINVWISLRNGSTKGLTPDDPRFSNGWLYVTTPRGWIAAVAVGAPNVPAAAGAAIGVSEHLHSMIREPGIYSVQWKAGTTSPMDYSAGSPAHQLESGIVTFNVVPE